MKDLLIVLANELEIIWPEYNLFDLFEYLFA